ncbi:MAG TPA: DUF3419 family protein [bacterium]|nr:DUF3419 family protein [bacterium]
MTCSSVKNRADFGFIRYANCWEDAEILCVALQPGHGRRILSIASGGDNAFRLAMDGGTVVAADLSYPQIACCRLKMEAIKMLGYPALLRFLGIHEDSTRLETYRQIRPHLDIATVTFWDRHPQVLARGIVHSGKFERYFQLFRTWILPLIHPCHRISALTRSGSRQDRECFYVSQWDTWRWRLLFRVFFSRFILGRLGRDPEFFRYVEGSVSDRILDRTRYALTVLPTDSNPYLDYILNGNYTHVMPPYLDASRYDDLKDAVSHIILVHGTIDEAAERHAGPGFDGYNLSDIFEYMDADTFVSTYRTLQASARSGARFAYWNMLVSRCCSGIPESRVTHLDELSRFLHSTDRAWFYSAFHVEQVRE